MSPVQGRRGVALMLVLWLIVVLGTIAVGVGAGVRSESDLVRTVRARAAARYAAESGILATKVRLQRALRAAPTPRDQVLLFRRLTDSAAGRAPETLGATRFQTVVINLNTRIDLNEADDATLLRFFGQFVDARRASALADALQDWRDADDLVRPNGAEAAEYARAGSPFRPTNRPLESLNELPRILGFSDSLAGVFAPYVTVQGDGRIDVNAAPAPVLAAGLGIGARGAALLIAQREGGTVFDSPVMVWAALRQVGASSWGGVDVTHLTMLPRRVLIVSRGWAIDHPLTHEIQAVFEVDGPAWSLRFWTERDR